MLLTYIMQENGNAYSTYQAKFSSYKKTVFDSRDKLSKLQIIEMH